jgi:hypothetical protein
VDQGKGRGPIGAHQGAPTVITRALTRRPETGYHIKWATIG